LTHEACTSYLPTCRDFQVATCLRPAGGLSRSNLQLGGALLSSMLRREIGQGGTWCQQSTSTIVLFFGALEVRVLRCRELLGTLCRLIRGEWRAGKPEPRLCKELMCSKLRHHRTFRGHSGAVYVLAIDHESRYVLSGSDDAVMKIWSLSTGVLLNSCRGHEVRDNCPVPLLLYIIAGTRLTFYTVVSGRDY
jgi:WD40 repeat protein